MSDAPGRRRGLWIGLGGAVCALLLGGLYWTLRAGEPGVEKELASGDAARMVAALSAADNEMLGSKEGGETRRLTIEAMKDMPIAELMKLLRGGDLTDEQREALFRNLQTLWMTYMADSAEEFFNAPPEEQAALLDRQLDDWKQFMDRMREYREAHQDDPEYQQMRERQRQRWQNQTKEDRKDRLESMNPDRQMKMFYMWRKMQERARERGLEMGPGSRGRGGSGNEAERRRGGRERERRPERERPGD